MSRLKRLQVSSLRNLKAVSIDLSSHINVFYGENGSGKTSLLEAVSLLGLGKSFRSYKARSLIHHQEQQLTVFGELELSSSRTLALGVQKERNGQSSIRINGEAILSAATLAQNLPLQIINPDSFQLIEGSPQQRRRFLDWMVFHVKPNFIDLWRRFQRVIKQRNSLLKHGKMVNSYLKSWDTEFCQLANKINGLRKEVFDDFNQIFSGFEQYLPDLSFISNIEVGYLAGWDTEKEIDSVLTANYDRDLRDGYTHCGPQRAEIKIAVEGKKASDVLSRGQEKVLICALYIAQAQLYYQSTGQQCVFLVDDLLSELDQKHAELLAKWLKSLNGQVFVTGVNKDNLINAWGLEPKESTLFHVKQGIVDVVNAVDIVKSH